MDGCAVVLGGYMKGIPFVTAGHITEEIRFDVALVSIPGLVVLIHPYKNSPVI